jgi:Mor family transcriptional regulator
MIPQEVCEAIRRDYEAGTYYKDIAEKYHVDHSTISRLITPNRGTLRITDIRSPEEIAAMRVDYENGMKIMDMRTKYHAAGATIARLARECGWVRDDAKVKMKVKKETVVGIRKDRQGGMRVKDIVAKYNVGHNTVYKYTADIEVTRTQEALPRLPWELWELVTLARGYELHNKLYWERLLKRDRRTINHVVDEMQIDGSWDMYRELSESAYRNIIKAYERRIAK